MAVVVGDLATLLNASGGGGSPYLFFRIYELQEATVDRYFSMAENWAGKQISSSTQTAEPDLFDDLILLEGAYRITNHIYSEVMATGFGFQTLNDTVNTSAFTELIKNRSDEYLRQRNEILGMIKPRVTISPIGQFGNNPYDIEDDLQHTASWRR